MSSAPTAPLKREVGLVGASMMGLGSIIGTGVFVSIGIAAGIAGSGVVPAVMLAAVVATCNALNSAQLAASHPVSGGTYEYGYRYLKPWLGFAAGWMFLCAKTASASTAALGFSGYLLNLVQLDAIPLPIVAVGTVLIVAAIVLAGVRFSSRVNISIVSVTLVALSVFVLGGLPVLSVTKLTADPSSVSSVLEATALMFVAYTGYGRIATLGEEVLEPRRTIPRAIITTLCISMILYLAVAVVVVGTPGSEAVRDSKGEPAAPLEMIARSFPFPAHRLVAVGAITAMLGVLLNLVLGLSRVALAMGRRHDLPSMMANPNMAVITVGLAIAGLAAIGSVKLTWSFSAFTVLVYYAITNLAALMLPAEQRLYPRAWAWGGLVACSFLAFWVEWRVWVAGLLLLAAGLLWHLARRRLAAWKAEYYS